MKSFLVSLALVFPIALPLGLGAAEPLQRDAPRCALLDFDKLDRVALLEAKLIGNSASTWVERTAVEEVLKEQKLQALFAANGVGERAKLGKLLKADLLVLARRSKEIQEPTVELIVCETSGGLRLLKSGLKESKSAAADVEALHAIVQEGMKKYAETVREIVAVPPLLSNNLTFENDFLKSAFAKLVEQTALSRPGIVAVELSEAEALAKEFALTADDRLRRAMPLYFIGEFRHRGLGEDRTISIKLQAERGGKPLGRAFDATMKPDDAPAAIRKWVSEFLDSIANDDKPTPLVDPKREAVHLGAVAAKHQLLGNWSESLPLFEAALLLDPERDQFRAEILAVLCHHITQVLRSPESDRLEGFIKYQQLQRRGLEHLETAVNRGAFSQYGFFDRSHRFLATIYNLPTWITPTWIEYESKLRTDRNEVLLRLIPIIAKEGKSEERVMVGYLFRRLSTKERYAILEKLIADNLDLPNPRERTSNWIAEAIKANVFASTRSDPNLEEKALVEFLGRLKGHENADLREVATKLDYRMLLRAARPSQTDRASPPLEPKGIGLRPVDLTCDKATRPNQSIYKILPLGPKIDLVRTLGSIFIMKEKGKLLSLPYLEKLEVDFTQADFDGKYVWATGVRRPNGGTPALVLFDPFAEKVWEVTSRDGLPTPPQERSKFESVPAILVAAIEEGRAALVGGYGGRTWVATATFNPKTATATVDIIHEARESGENVTEERSRLSTLGFQPNYIFPIRNSTDPKADIERRLIVGRAAPSFRISDYPLVIDPDRRTATVSRDAIKPCYYGGFTESNRFGRTHDSIYYVERGPANVCRFGFPELSRQPLRVPVPESILFEAAVVHEGYFYFIRQSTISPKATENSTSQVRTLTRQTYELWSMNLETKKLRQLGTNLPHVASIAVSAHYGLVCFVSPPWKNNGISGGFRAIEFEKDSEK